MRHAKHADGGAEASHRQRKSQAASTNGAHEEPAGADKTPEQPADGREDAMRQAEEMADHLAERVGFYASWISRAVMTLAARAREEAADIWAEAEHLSRKTRS